MSQLPCPPSNRSVSRLFASTLQSMLWVCVLVSIVIGAATLIWAPEWFWQAQVIVAGSGLISVLALLPGILVGAPVGSMKGRTMTFVIGCFAAKAIRILGTVALFVACRYQMSLPTETMAFLVGGTYLFLTSVEIHLLVRSASELGVVSPRSASASIDQSRVLSGQYSGES